MRARRLLIKQQESEHREQHASCRATHVERSKRSRQQQRVGTSHVRASHVGASKPGKFLGRWAWRG